MPRKSKNKSGHSGARATRGGLGNDTDRIVTVRGKILVSFDHTSSFKFAAFGLRPTNFDRLSTIKAVYELYRFTRIKIKSMPVSTGETVFGFIPGNYVTTPAGFDSVKTMTLGVSAIFFPAQTVPLVMMIPRSALLAEGEWYPTNDTFGAGGVTGSAPFAQGIIIAAQNSSVAATVPAEIEYEIQFKGQVYLNLNSTPVSNPPLPPHVERKEASKPRAPDEHDHSDFSDWHV